MHDHVRGTAEVARYAAQGEADQQREAHPAQADGERDARAVHDAREQVAAHTVGAEQEHHTPFRNREQVAVGGEQPPQPVLGAAPEEPDRVALGGRCIHAAQRFLVDVLLQSHHVGCGQTSIGKQADALRRDEYVRDVALLQRVGRDERCQEPDQVGDRQHRGADQGQPMAFEVAPHELPLRGEVVAFPLVGVPGVARRRLRWRVGHALGLCPLEADARVEYHQQDVRYQGADHRQRGQYEQERTGQEHVLAE